MGIRVQEAALVIRMTTIADHSVRELGLIRLRLRGDLTFTPQTAVGAPYYLVEDPLNSRFFRLGLVEYTFVSLLDGRTTIQDALRALSGVMPHHRLTEQDAAGLCRWLVDMDLAHTDESSQGARLVQSAQTIENRKAAARWNPLIFRLPLGRPDPLFARLTAWFGWLHSPPAVLGWLMLLALGGYAVLSDWDRFTASSHVVFAPGNWLWLAACWLVLKIVHEASHGIACRRLGGAVRETGVLFVLFAPLAYVDVTASWRFRRRRDRIQVAAAGMYVELLIAAVAALVWSNTGPGWLNNLCFNLVFMASVATLLFNSNPLMKFDGYYILSDALVLPNLSGSGQLYLRYWAKRYLLGIDSALPAWSPRDAVLVRIYGVASFVWRMLVTAGLIITATTLFHGAGIVLAGVAVVLWLGLPTIGFIKYLLFGKPGERPRRLQFCLTAGSAAAIAVAVLGFVPWPGARNAPAVVEYSPHTVVRASSAGFVREIHVQSGQSVQAGQLLIVLENRELACELADLELQIRQSEVRGQRHQQKGEVAQEQAEAKNREGLSTQLLEKRAQNVQLSVRAAHTGRVVRRNLAAMLDTYLAEGDEILAIGEESQKELRVSLSQDDLDAFTQLSGKPVDIDLPRHASWPGEVKSVDPRATLTPAHPALVTANGGPLPVQPARHRPDKSASEMHELLAPRFNAIIALTATDSESLRSGQLATISYRPCNESIGEYLYQAVSRWVRERMRSNAD